MEEKIYNRSRIILAVISFIVFLKLIGNLIGNIPLWLVPLIFSIITYGISFFTSKISKKMIIIGDNIKNIVLKILYYIVIPIFSVLICILVYIVGEIIFAYIPIKSDLSGALWQACKFLFITIVICIGIILPYFQTLIVLFLRKFERN